MELVGGYTTRYVAQDFSWLSDHRGHCVLTWKRAGLSFASAFGVIMLPTPPADQPLLRVASLRPLAYRLAMLLQRYARCVPSADDLGKAQAARFGASDFLGKNKLALRDFLPA
jgi:hypothetical protein